MRMETSELSPRAADIAACAQSLLATRGYNGFSYADISEAVHISNASIHFHLPTKADLVQTVLKRYREKGREALAALEKHVADPLSRLHYYTGYWAACIREAPPLCICAMVDLNCLQSPTWWQKRFGDTLWTWAIGWRRSWNKEPPRGFSDCEPILRRRRRS